MTGTSAATSTSTRAAGGREIGRTAAVHGDIESVPLADTTVTLPESAGSQRAINRDSGTDRGALPRPARVVASPPASSAQPDRFTLPPAPTTSHQSGRVGSVAAPLAPRPDVSSVRDDLGHSAPTAAGTNRGMLRAAVLASAAPLVATAALLVGTASEANATPAPPHASASTVTAQGTQPRVQVTPTADTASAPPDPLADCLKDTAEDWTAFKQGPIQTHPSVLVPSVSERFDGVETRRQAMLKETPHPTLESCEAVEEAGVAARQALLQQLADLADKTEVELGPTLERAKANVDEDPVISWPIVNSLLKIHAEALAERQKATGVNPSDSDGTSLVLVGLGLAVGGAFGGYKLRGKLANIK